MPAAEDVQRQIAIAVVVAVEVPTFLLAVNGIIGGIEVEHDAGRRLGVGIEKEIDEQPLDRTAIVVELVVTILADLASVLHPIERRLASERAARLVEHGGECRIVPQRVVVDQVLMAERDAEDALAQQVGYRMTDQGLNDREHP